jgi:predicted metal-dependent hydrolase
LKTVKNNYTDTFLTIENIIVPLRIYIERRRTIRISLGKDNILMRLPVYEAPKLEHHIDGAKKWLNSLIIIDKQVLEKYHVNQYLEKRELKILGQDIYQLNIFENKDARGEISLKNGEIVLNIPTSLDPFEKRIMIRTLLTKVLTKRYKKFVEDRIKYWNDKYFGKELLGVTIRYNSTNWGSCSSNKRINISTRSLLLPLEVFDYILVHELSHLVEMNHSERFWKVVKNVMPNYEEAELWIKTNHANLDF